MSSKPIALTMGEPAGIAGEITIKAWNAPDGRPVPSFVALADPDQLRAEVHQLKLHTHILEVSSFEEGARRFHEGIPVLPVKLVSRPAPGRPLEANSKAIVSSIDRAMEAVLLKQAKAIVTNPIAKSSLYKSGFSFPGHTEYLAARFQPTVPVMMLAIPELRVIPVTVHLSLAGAIKSLTPELIVNTARTAYHALKSDFGIQEPRIAIAALNPHAGEEGAMGREEIDIIIPAIEQLRQLGIYAKGPFPADSLFHRAARQNYDAVICMYHDQALLPLKTIDFSSGVNITLGLPMIRTSPDHGTAFDIAGQNKADASSLLAALRMASLLAQTRSPNA